MHTIDAYLKSPATAPVSREERIAAATELQRLRHNLATHLLSIPAAHPQVDRWAATVGANESGFTVPRKLGIKDFRLMFPELIGILSDLRDPDARLRRKARRALGSMMEKRFVIDSARLRQIIDRLADAEERYLAEEARVKAIFGWREETPGYSERVLAKHPQDARQADFLGLSAALSNLRTIRAEIGLPLASLREARQAAETLMEEFLRKRERFWTNNARALATTIRDKAKACGMTKLEIHRHFDDLFHAVMSDCLPVLDRYDPAAGSISTFLARFILGSVRIWLHEHRNAAYIPEKDGKMILKLRRELARSAALEEQRPTDLELAAAIGLYDPDSAKGATPAERAKDLARKEKEARGRITAMLRAMEFTASLDAPTMNDDEGSATLGDTLASEDEDAFDKVSDPEFTARFRAIIQRVLPPQLRRVLARARGLDGEVWSRKEIAAAEADYKGLPVTEETVGAILAAAKKLLLRDSEFQAMGNEVRHRRDERHDEPEMERPAAAFRWCLLFEKDEAIPDGFDLGSQAPFYDWETPAWPHDDGDDDWIAGEPAREVIVIRRRKVHADAVIRPSAAAISRALEGLSRATAA